SPAGRIAGPRSVGRSGSPVPSGAVRPPTKGPAPQSDGLGQTDDVQGGARSNGSGHLFNQRLSWERGALRLSRASCEQDVQRRRGERVAVLFSEARRTRFSFVCCGGGSSLSSSICPESSR